MKNKFPSDGMKHANILTATLNGSIGMQGFEGEYAIKSPDDIIEIYVQFATPPAASLKCIKEKKITYKRRTLPETCYREQALSAHVAFKNQLEELLISDLVHIIDEHHLLFNGVLMSVPSKMVELIAGLPEVYSVFPNVTIYPEYDSINEQTKDADITDLQVENSQTTTNDPDPFFVNADFMRVTRDYLNIDHINRNLVINGRTGFTGAGVQVAVLDSGIQHDHPEFWRFQDPATRAIDENTGEPIPGTGRIRGRGHPIEGNAHPTVLTDLLRNHGTTVSGAVIGIAPNIELWHYRVGAGGMGAIAAIEAAIEDGADVINMSFGYPIHNPFTPYSSTISTAVVTQGVVVVSSAGNSGENGNFTITSPGPESLAITVGAGQAGGANDPVGEADIVPDYSSRGPLQETYHIKPDIVAPTNLITTNIDSGYTDGKTRGISPHTPSQQAGGTSHAAPIIAGIAALLIEAYPDADPLEIKARIMNSSRQMTGDFTNYIFSSGAGFVQPIEALRANSIVTVTHGIPINNNRALSFESAIMASLSFGSTDAYNNTMPIQITNRGSTAQTYMINCEFINNPNTAADILFSHAGITIDAGNNSNIDATLIFEDDAPLGRYEGYILVKTGEFVVARLPFLAILTETDKSALSTTAPNLSFNGISFNLGVVNLFATNDFQGNDDTLFDKTNPSPIGRGNVLVGINKHPIVGNELLPTNIEIEAGESIDVTDSGAVNTFLPREYIEIKVYRNDVRQHLLNRHIIHPAVITFT
jgi:subtilisin family serine protease